MNLIKKNATDVTRYVMLVDSAAGTPETGYTITSIDLTYVRNRGSASKTDATALGSVDASHDDNKAYEVDGTNCPGLYRIDWPDAAFATGVDKVLLVVNGTGLHPAVEEIQLVDFDVSDGVRLGLTSLPNATPAGNGGLPTVDSSNYVAGILAIANGAVTAAAIAQDAIDADSLKADAITEIQSGLSTLDAAGVRSAVGLASANLDTQLGTIDGNVDSILSDTGTDGVLLASGSITASVIATDAIDADAIKADAVTEIQSGLSTLDAAGIRSAVGIASANLDTQLGTIDGNVDSILADTGTDGVLLAAGAVTATTIATDAIDADSIKADAVTKIQSGLSTLTSAQANAACDEALETYQLDILTKNPIGEHEIATGSVVSMLGSKEAGGEWASYDNTTDSLEAVRDRGDAAWVTGEGSSLTAAAIAAAMFEENAGTYAGSAAGSVVKEIADNAGGSSLTESGIADAVCDEALTGHVTAGTLGKIISTINTNVAAINPVTVTVQSVVAEDGSIEIVAGRDYHDESAVTLSRTWAGDSLSGVSAATLRAVPDSTYQDGDSVATLSKAGTLAIDGTTITVAFELSASDTAELATQPPNQDGNYVYEVVATTTDSKTVCLFLGSMTVKQGVAAA